MKKEILPPAYFMSAILLIAIIHFTIPVLKFINFPWNLSGLLLLILGGILNLIADNSFKNPNTTVKPFEYSSKLIQNGIFKITRNPMYLGMIFLLLGESILMGSILPFLITIGFTLIMFFGFIKTEEKMLLEKFNEEYLSYKQKVRRWI